MGVDNSSVEANPRPMLCLKIGGAVLHSLNELWDRLSLTVVPRQQHHKHCFLCVAIISYHQTETSFDILVKSPIRTSTIVVVTRIIGFTRVNFNKKNFIVRALYSVQLYLECVLVCSHAVSQYVLNV